MLNDNEKPVGEMSLWELGNELQRCRAQMELIKAEKIIGWGEYIEFGPKGKTA